VESRYRVSRRPVDCLYARVGEGEFCGQVLFILISNRRTIARVKRCPSCGETKRHSEFHLHRRRRDGLQSICKRCRKVLDHALYERRRGTRTPSRMWEQGRAAWLVSLKAGRPCTDCRRTYAPQVMQWDHLPGSLKLGNISTDLRGRSRQEILDEISKCELVCANCHAIRTFKRAARGGISERVCEYDFRHGDRTAA
jgi:hypothetical protein